MKLQEYLNMKNDYIIKNVSLLENDDYIINKELYEDIYDHLIVNNEVGYHLLTYSTNDSNLQTELYIYLDKNKFDNTNINKDVKLKINYNTNKLIFNFFLNTHEGRVKIPIVINLVNEYSSIELSQFLKQKHVNLYIISRSEEKLFKEDIIQMHINDKMKSIVIEFLELFLDSYDLYDKEKIIDFENLLINNGDANIKISIYKEDIEKMNVSKYENILLTLYPNVLLTHNLYEKIDLFLCGYKSDSKREVWQIPEVRRFIKALNEKFPYWFYFLNKNNKSLFWITMCVCGKNFGDKERYSINNMQFHDFINEQLNHAKEVCYYVNDLKEYDKLKEEVFKYYDIL